MFSKSVHGMLFILLSIVIWYQSRKMCKFERNLQREFREPFASRKLSFHYPSFELLICDEMFSKSTLTISFILLSIVIWYQSRKMCKFERNRSSEFREPFASRKLSFHYPSFELDWFVTKCSRNLCLECCLYFSQLWFGINPAKCASLRKIVGVNFENHLLLES